MSLIRKKIHQKKQIRKTFTNRSYLLFEENLNELEITKNNFQLNIKNNDFIERFNFYLNSSRYKINLAYIIISYYNNGNIDYIKNNHIKLINYIFNCLQENNNTKENFIWFQALIIIFHIIQYNIKINDGKFLILWENKLIKFQSFNKLFFLIIKIIVNLGNLYLCLKLNNIIMIIKNKLALGELEKYNSYFYLSLYFFTDLIKNQINQEDIIKITIYLIYINNRLEFEFYNETFKQIKYYLNKNSDIKVIDFLDKFDLFKYWFNIINVVNNLNFNIEVLDLILMLLNYDDVIFYFKSEYAIKFVLFLGSDNYGYNLYKLYDKIVNILLIIFDEKYDIFNEIKDINILDILIYDFRRNYDNFNTNKSLLIFKIISHFYSNNFDKNIGLIEYYWDILLRNYQIYFNNKDENIYSIINYFMEYNIFKNFIKNHENFNFLDTNIRYNSNNY